MVAALVGGGYLYLHLDDQICRHVERLFGGHYKTLVVDVGSARYEQGRGIYVNNLVNPKAAQGGRAPANTLDRRVVSGQRLPPGRS